jgi:hypothetical protein
MDINLLISLGAFSALLVLGYSAFGVFKLNKQVSDLESRNFTRDMETQNLERDIHQRIDGDVMSLDNSLVGIERKMEKEFDEIWRQMDSRLDKLENRITSKIPPTNDEVLKELANLKEEFLTLRKNL